MQQGSELPIASADVKNAFYFLEIPESLSQKFTSPRIKYSHIKHFHHILFIQDNEYVLPSLKVLPMGWSWSLHFCQKFVSNVIAEVVGEDRVIVDRAAGVEIKKGGPCAGAAYEYFLCFRSGHQTC